MNIRRITKSALFGATATVAVLGLTALAVACGEGAKADAGATSVKVTLDEWVLAPTPASVPAGKVAFTVTNDGTQDLAFAVIKTDYPAGALPVNVDGSANWNGQGVQIVKGVESVEVGKSRLVVLDMQPGNYVLMDNTVETVATGAYLSHYKEGMHAAFRVD